jgi:hypothetical protein
MGESYDLLTLQAETDALCKMHQLHVLTRSCPGMYATVFKMDSLLLGKFYKDKILLVGGNREKTELLKVRVAFPRFNLGVSPVADAMEQDFLGRLPNSNVFLKEMFGQAPAANL